MEFPFKILFCGHIKECLTKNSSDNNNENVKLEVLLKTTKYHKLILQNHLS